MTRRLSGPLWPELGIFILLLVIVPSTLAAPLQETTEISDSNTKGCYYNYNRYSEGDRILTNEPCLNCTCHNTMLMCYLRVCPFTKPIGQDCTIEKREDQCCPIITCPEVPVELLENGNGQQSTSLAAPDRFGCSIDNRFYPEGAQIPSNPRKPCELCYCIRNMTSCVMQECTLHVDGCRPIYNKGVCCPVRYSCAHDFDESMMIEDAHTTERPTEGFMLTTTMASTDVSTDCIHNGEVLFDGARLDSEDKPCEHCYCMRGKLVCAVTECGKPLESEGKNCTARLPKANQCCPEYDCGDVRESGLTTEYPEDMLGATVSVTDRLSEEAITEQAVEDSDKSTSIKPSDEVESDNVNEIEDDGVEHKTTLASVVPETTVTALSEQVVDHITTTERTIHDDDLDLQEHIDEATEDKKPSLTTETSRLPSDQQATTIAPQADDIVGADHTEPATSVPDSDAGAEQPTTIAAAADIDNADVDINTVIPNTIPGEGDCLSDGKSYRNNSAIPSTSKCEMSCVCINSIVQCQSIKCPPPPAHVLNCQPIYDEQKSCCPTYDCHVDSTERIQSDDLATQKEPSEGPTEAPVRAEVAKPASTSVGSTESPTADKSDLATEAAVTKETGSEPTEAGVDTSTDKEIEKVSEPLETTESSLEMVTKKKPSADDVTEAAMPPVSDVSDESEGSGTEDTLEAETEKQAAVDKSTDSVVESATEVRPTDDKVSSAAAVTEGPLSDEITDTLTEKATEKGVVKDTKKDESTESPEGSSTQKDVTKDAEPTGVDATETSVDTVTEKDVAKEAEPSDEDASEATATDKDMVKGAEPATEASLGITTEKEVAKGDEPVDGDSTEASLGTATEKDMVKDTKPADVDASLDATTEKDVAKDAEPVESDASLVDTTEKDLVKSTETSLGATTEKDVVKDVEPVERDSTEASLGSPTEKDADTATDKGVDEKTETADSLPTEASLAVTTEKAVKPTAFGDSTEDSLGSVTEKDQVTDVLPSVDSITEAEPALGEPTEPTFTTATEKDIIKGAAPTDGQATKPSESAEDESTKPSAPSATEKISIVFAEPALDDQIVVSVTEKDASEVPTVTEKDEIKDTEIITLSPATDKEEKPADEKTTEQSSVTDKISGEPITESSADSIKPATEIADTVTFAPEKTSEDKETGLESTEASPASATDTISEDQSSQASPIQLSEEPIIVTESIEAIEQAPERTTEHGLLIHVDEQTVIPDDETTDGTEEMVGISLTTPSDKLSAEEEINTTATTASSSDGQQEQTELPLLIKVEAETEKVAGSDKETKKDIEVPTTPSSIGADISTPEGSGDEDDIEKSTSMGIIVAQDEISETTESQTTKAPGTDSSDEQPEVVDTVTPAAGAEESIKPTPSTDPEAATNIPIDSLIVTVLPADIPTDTEQAEPATGTVDFKIDEDEMVGAERATDQSVTDKIQPADDVVTVTPSAEQSTSAASSEPATLAASPEKKEKQDNDQVESTEPSEISAPVTAASGDQLIQEGEPVTIEDVASTDKAIQTDETTSAAEQESTLAPVAPHLGDKSTPDLEKPAILSDDLSTTTTSAEDVSATESIKTSDLKPTKTSSVTEGPATLSDSSSTSEAITATGDETTVKEGIPDIATEPAVGKDEPVTGEVPSDSDEDIEADKFTSKPESVTVSIEQEDVTPQKLDDNIIVPEETSTVGTTKPDEISKPDEATPYPADSKSTDSPVSEDQTTKYGKPSETVTESDVAKVDEKQPESLTTHAPKSESDETVEPENITRPSGLGIPSATVMATSDATESDEGKVTEKAGKEGTVTESEVGVEKVTESIDEDKVTEHSPKIEDEEKVTASKAADELVTESKVDQDKVTESIGEDRPTEQPPKADDEEKVTVSTSSEEKVTEQSPEKKDEDNVSVSIAGEEKVTAQPPKDVDQELVTESKTDQQEITETPKTDDGEKVTKPEAVDEKVTEQSTKADDMEKVTESKTDEDIVTQQPLTTDIEDKTTEQSPKADDKDKHRPIDEEAAITATTAQPSQEQQTKEPLVEFAQEPIVSDKSESKPKPSDQPSTIAPKHDEPASTSSEDDSTDEITEKMILPDAEQPQVQSHPETVNLVKADDALDATTVTLPASADEDQKSTESDQELAAAATTVQTPKQEEEPKDTSTESIEKAHPDVSVTTVLAPMHDTAPKDDELVTKSPQQTEEEKTNEPSLAAAPASATDVPSSDELASVTPDITESSHAQDVSTDTTPSQDKPESDISEIQEASGQGIDEDDTSSEHPATKPAEEQKPISPTETPSLQMHDLTTLLPVLGQTDDSLVPTTKKPEDQPTKAVEPTAPVTAQPSDDSSTVQESDVTKRPTSISGSDIDETATDIPSEGQTAAAPHSDDDKTPAVPLDVDRPTEKPLTDTDDLTSGTESVAASPAVTSSPAAADSEIEKSTEAETLSKTTTEAGVVEPAPETFTTEQPPSQVATEVPLIEGAVDSKKPEHDYIEATESADGQKSTETTPVDDKQKEVAVADSIGSTTSTTSLATADTTSEPEESIEGSGQPSEGPIESVTTQKSEQPIEDITLIPASSATTEKSDTAQTSEEADTAKPSEHDASTESASAKPIVHDEIEMVTDKKADEIGTAAGTETSLSQGTDATITDDATEGLKPTVTDKVETDDTQQTVEPASESDTAPSGTTTAPSKVDSETGITDRASEIDVTTVTSIHKDEQLTEKPETTEKAAPVLVATKPVSSDGITFPSDDETATESDVSDASTSKAQDAIVPATTASAAQEDIGSATDKPVKQTGDADATPEVDNRFDEGKPSVATEKADAEVTEVADVAVTEKAGAEVTEKTGAEVTEKDSAATTDKSGVAVTEKSDAEGTETAGDEVNEKAGAEVTEKAIAEVTDKSTGQTADEVTAVADTDEVTDKQAEVTEQPADGATDKVADEVTEKVADEVAGADTATHADDVTEKSTDGSVTDEHADEVTEKSSDKVTEKAPGAVTDKQIDEVTEKAGAEVTGTTEKIAVEVTDDTDKATDEATETISSAVTDKQADEISEIPTDKAPLQPTDEATASEKAPLRPTDEATASEMDPQSSTEKAADAAPENITDTSDVLTAHEVTDKTAQDATDKPADQVTDKAAEAITDQSIDAVTEQEPEAITPKATEPITPTDSESVTVKDKASETVTTSRPVHDATPDIEVTQQPDEITKRPALADSVSETDTTSRPVHDATPDIEVTQQPEEITDKAAEDITDQSIDVVSEQEPEAITPKATEPIAPIDSESVTGKDKASETDTTSSPVHDVSPDIEVTQQPEEITKRPALADSALTTEPAEPSTTTTQKLTAPAATYIPSAENKTESDAVVPTDRPTSILDNFTHKPAHTDVPVSTTSWPMPSYPSAEPEDEYTDEEDPAAFGPGTCRYGGKLYVSAQQIPRDDPCDFCFCFRSDIICLQQSCPPPISGCHEEPIQGFCCPRYECHVSMATVMNVTTSTTTTSTTLPPHFLHHAYKGAATKRGCQIQGHSYQVGEVVNSASGPCMHCICGGDGQMQCEPKVCTPEPMLRQMIAIAASRRR